MTQHPVECGSRHDNTLMGHHIIGMVRFVIALWDGALLVWEASLLVSATFSAHTRGHTGDPEGDTNNRNIYIILDAIIFFWGGTLTSGWSCMVLQTVLQRVFIGVLWCQGFYFAVLSKKHFL
jgi:hypothetical protein